MAATSISEPTLLKAKQAVERAIVNDLSGQSRMLALKFYEFGIRQVLSVMGNLPGRPSEHDRALAKSKIEQYVRRSIQLDQIIIPATKKEILVENIRIYDGEIGHSYESIFDKYLTEEVTDIFIDEPYLAELYQVRNLRNFCHLAGNRCPQLNTIVVTSHKMPANAKAQAALESLVTKLYRCPDRVHVNLLIEFYGLRHDRQIILSNGCRVKIGRGLNYFKGPENGENIEQFETRQCLETEVDIMLPSKRFK